MDNYMDEFLNELQKYILKIVDVHMNGNCGYKEIVARLGQGQESRSLVCQDLIWELQT